MKPRKKIDQTSTPNGNDLILFQHDNDFYMQVDRHELMSSRRHESELELGRIGGQQAAQLASAPVRILIGGLGMGYTLRATLDLLPPEAEVVVAELLADVVRWNRDIIGHLAGHPLKDKRVSLQNCNVLKVLQESPNAFDAILLDIDNGPAAFSDSANDELYSEVGIQMILHALKQQGGLYLWSAGLVRAFERRLKRAGLKVKSHKVKAHKHAKKRTHYIVAAYRFS
ncbi:MnmC family methyltransferase [Oligoflexia bacterium]|nr:MnmC family methyltransferase [Oligoflexia bacterium]